MKTVTLTEARNQLLRLANEIGRKPATVVNVVKRGKHVMTLMSSELYESLVETLEILGEESTVTKLRRALKEIEEEKGIPWREAKKKLGLEG